jgi:hypothetical protein
MMNSPRALAASKAYVIDEMENEIVLTFKFWVAVVQDLAPAMCGV